jgi:hypothetical protein
MALGALKRRSGDMRAICSNVKCEDRDIPKKVHEDFEDLEFILCWKCGEDVLEMMKERFPKWDLSSL